MSESKDKNENAYNAGASVGFDLNVIQTLAGSAATAAINNAKKRGIPQEDMQAALTQIARYMEAPRYKEGTIAYGIDLAISVFCAGLEQGRAERRNAGRGEAAQ